MVRPSRLFGLLAAFAACGALCLGALAGPAAGLSDAEYREMMKDRDFAEADRALNEAWSRILKEGGLSEAGIKALKAEQEEWVKKGRDAAARRNMAEFGYTAVRAYASATSERVDDLPYIVEPIFLQDRPDGPQGYYVRREDGRETGLLSVRWIDKKAGKLKVGMEANLVLGPKDLEYRYWSGEGTVRKGVLKALDGEESATFTFKGDKVQVVASPGFSSSTVGLGVTIEGTYIRQKLPRP